MLINGWNNKIWGEKPNHVNNMSTDYFKRVHTALAAGIALIDDKTASIAPEVFDRLKQVTDPEAEIPLIKAGTRINWNGQLKRAAVDLWDTKENNPDNAPTLWEDIAYREGYRIIPSEITAGTAFAKDELGWWNDMLYKSLIDANVWTPEAHAAGWEKAE